MVTRPERDGYRASEREREADSEYLHQACVAPRPRQVRCRTKKGGCTPRYVYLSIYLSIYPFVHPSIYLSINRLCCDHRHYHHQAGVALRPRQLHRVQGLGFGVERVQGLHRLRRNYRHQACVANSQGEQTFTLHTNNLST